MQAPSLGILMIARDEERNLAKSLLPLMNVVDEAVFLDTGSTDQGPEMAEKAGARVYRLPWPGDFSAARNAALARMTADYVLWLDGDNSVGPQELLTFKKKIDPKPTIYLATERIVPQGDEIWQKRIFPNRPEFRWEGKIHEQLTHPADCPVAHSRLVFEHWGYADSKLAKAKAERNLSLLLESGEPTDPYAAYQTGRTLVNLRRHQEARPFLERAAEMAENPAFFAHSLILLSRAYLAAGEPAKALASLRRLTQARPDYGPGHYYLGRFLADHEPKAAAAALESALALGLADPAWGANGPKLAFAAALLLGKLHLKALNLKAAKKALAKAASLDPNSPEPRLGLAKVAFAAGRAREAQAILTKVLARFPGLRSAKALLAERGQP
ncbi:MAG: tetratricopeptide repeat protein [Deltaproteobacteria bacterium]|jgi:glycosyltransferase involved in cell wall biosynthesis|nr:tetratricopeptide repeat protein [Deltaproteobacteria bacterium]